MLTSSDDDDGEDVGDEVDDDDDVNLNDSDDDDGDNDRQDWADRLHPQLYV